MGQSIWVIDEFFFIRKFYIILLDVLMRLGSLKLTAYKNFYFNIQFNLIKKNALLSLNHNLKVYLYKDTRKHKN